MRGTLKKAQAEVAFIKHDDFYIELFQVTGAATMPESRRHPDTDIATHGTKHIAFEVEDIHELINVLRQRGADIVSERDQNAFIHDNSGILIEFIQTGWKLNIVQ